MRRYLDYLASGPEQSHQGVQRLRQRIDRSSAPVCVQNSMNGDTRTYEYEYAFSIVLPAFDHLAVFILCGLGVQCEERTGAVSEDGFIRLLIRC